MSRSLFVLFPNKKCWGLLGEGRCGHSYFLLPLAFGIICWVTLIPLARGWSCPLVCRSWVMSHDFISLIKNAFERRKQATSSKLASNKQLRAKTFKFAFLSSLNLHQLVNKQLPVSLLTSLIISNYTRYQSELNLNLNFTHPVHCKSITKKWHHPMKKDGETTQMTKTTTPLNLPPHPHPKPSPSHPRTPHA